MVEDITEQKKIEAEVQKEKLINENILECTPGIIYIYEVINDSLKLVKWNKNHETLLGYSSDELFQISPKGAF
jgi:PAS domain-containing protein